ncbi:hypothetical protein EJB05_14070, partial [Eragrostis curvula]
MAPPLPPLVEELVEEILIRLPPDDPASLVRAALVSTPWRRLISDPGFRRRFRRFHREAPMLGFFYVSREQIHNNRDSDVYPYEEVSIARFAPTSSSCPPHAVQAGLWVSDARHGRVLLRTLQSSNKPLVLWDPVTDDHQELPILPHLEFLHGCSWSAKVLCAAEGTCDHLDCCHGPFNVVVVATASKEVLSSCTYSSEFGRWSEPTFARQPSEHYLFHERGTLAENSLYFLFNGGHEILKYDLGTREMSLIDIPETFCYRRPIVLMTTKDGRLGFAKKIANTLQLWTREVAHDRARWDTYFRGPKLICAADGVGVFFMKTKIGLFMIDQKSGLARKAEVDMDATSDIVPYINFYTPGTRFFFIFGIGLKREP